jgi:hypothetical protein
MKFAAVLPVFVLCGCVAPGETAQGTLVGSTTVGDTSFGADSAPMDEGNGLVGFVSGGSDDTFSQSWRYSLLNCATGSSVFVQTFDEAGVSEKRALRLARFVDMQRKAGVTGSLQSFFHASQNAGMKPLEIQSKKGLDDESGCKKHYPNVARDWPEWTDADEAQFRRQMPLIIEAVVGLKVIAP